MSMPGTKSALTKIIPMVRSKNAVRTRPLRIAICWARRMTDAIIPGFDRHRIATPGQLGRSPGR